MKIGQAVSLQRLRIVLGAYLVQSLNHWSHLSGRSENKNFICCSPWSIRIFQISDPKNPRGKLVLFNSLDFLDPWSFHLFQSQISLPYSPKTQNIEKVGKPPHRWVNITKAKKTSIVRPKRHPHTCVTNAEMKFEWRFGIIRTDILEIIFKSHGTFYFRQFFIYYLSHNCYF